MQRKPQFQGLRVAGYTLFMIPFDFALLILEWENASLSGFWITVTTAPPPMLRAKPNDPIIVETIFTAYPLP
ncbi:MAG: hypothetical protein R3C59_05845 [Planctomycetaceae bacterium]